MTVSTGKEPGGSAYRTGIRDGWPFVFVVIPFSTLFGVVATDAGLTLAQAMGFSVLVIAGASQFAALQLMVENAAIALVLLAALAVNLRMAMYSVSLVPYMGDAPLWRRALVAYMMFDQTYITSISKFENTPEMSVADRYRYFFGVATPVVPTWIAMTWVGVITGATIPESWALDFILPITFLSMCAPLLKSLAHVAAAGVSIIVALALIGLPSGTGLLIAAFCAMITGACVETWMERRR